jgi:hypothetical protein
VNNGFTIFGSYVREYMCGRPFNPAISDIDVFSATQNIRDLGILFESNGFRCSHVDCSSSRYALGPNELFTFTVGLHNDMFFTGHTLDVKIDFVFPDPKQFNPDINITPPFHFLDFACNAWIWDSTGIRLSRCTGTSLDKLSPREIKYAEIDVLENCKNFNTQYYPMDNDGDLRSLVENPKRVKRLERLDKMLFSGWSIQGINLEKVPAEDVGPDDICTVCQDTIISDCSEKSTPSSNKIGDCTKLQCCDAKYHRECFLRYGSSELTTRTFIRCSQRCSELHL